MAIEFPFQIVFPNGIGPGDDTSIYVCTQCVKHTSCVTYGTDGDFVDYVKGANIAGFVKVAYDGELLKYLQSQYFTTLKFCPVNIAETIDISTGVINLNTIRAIRAMQPGIKKGEVGLLPSHV